MDEYVITNGYRAMKYFDTEKGAKIALKRCPRKYPRGFVQSLAEFRANDKMVKVKSLMNGAEVEIRQSQVGGPCDVSTEAYWSA
jgi:hypothetical protein